MLMILIKTIISLIYNSKNVIPRWSYIAPMCLPRERLGMCAIKGTVYAIGGRRGRSPIICYITIKGTVYAIGGRRGRSPIICYITIKKE